MLIRVVIIIVIVVILIFLSKLSSIIKGKQTVDLFDTVYIYIIYIEEKRVNTNHLEKSDGKLCL